MTVMPESELSQEVLAWRDPEMPSVKGTETPKDPNKGYIALLGWSVNAIKAAQNFDRRYIVIAPEWATDFCTANNIPFIP
ncbi:carboxylate--amine ligase, partial [Marinobacter orientalis]